MMATQDDLQFYLVGNPQSVRLQLIEIDHPAFTQTFRFVRNHAQGVTVTHEDGVTARYEYLPIPIQKSKSSTDLDQSLNITIGDTGEIIPQQIDRIRKSDLFYNVKPVVNYREYYLDNLSTPCLVDRNLEVIDYSMHKEGVAFRCEAKDITNTKTGRVFTLDTHPALRAFVV